MRTIKALDESTWLAFADLAGNSNGFPSGCWRMGFHPEGVGKDTTAELNRDRKLGRVRDGTTHAALVLDDDLCVGWCQFGSPEELPRIKSRVAYEKTLRQLPDWRITCFYVRRATGAMVCRRLRWPERSISSPSQVAESSRATRSLPVRSLRGSCSTGR